MNWIILFLAPPHGLKLNSADDSAYGMRENGTKKGLKVLGDDPKN